MATYKVIQDIEAEDKLLGPLTLRQFIYGVVAATCGYFCFIGFAKHFYPLIVVFFPIMLLAGFFAFPFGRDQPTEVWALAKVRFLLLPRRRIWNQSGIKELVTITAPKQVDHYYSDNLSQTEVKSRLQALADTIDSRGWVIKNVAPGQAARPNASSSPSDRLLDFSSSPQEVGNMEIRPQDDILDENNNRTAANFDQMINHAEASHRQRLMDQMMQGAANPSAPIAPTSQAAPDNLWFLNQPPGASTAPVNNTSVVTPGSSDDSANTSNDDKALAAQLKANKKSPQTSYSHLQTVQPLSAQDASTNQPAPDTTATTTTTDNKADDNQTDNAKIEQSRLAVEQAMLARNNDLNIATIARQVHHKPETDADEVVISLH